MDASRLVNLQKSYGRGELRTQVLFDIDVTVRTGEMTLLVGPSGCGKTTLISIIAGILSADSGEIYLFDEPLHRLNGSRRTQVRKKYLGFIFQQYNLVPTLTALENVAVPLLISGVSTKEASRRAYDCLEQVELEQKALSLPKELSGGQQQRVAIARALVREPKLIICDEPTAALDGKTGRRMMEFLKAIAVKPDCAVIVVTHDNRIVDFADRVIEMDDGRVIEDRQVTNPALYSL